MCGTYSRCLPVPRTASRTHKAATERLAEAAPRRTRGPWSHSADKWPTRPLSGDSTRNLFMAAVEVHQGMRLRIGVSARSGEVVNSSENPPPAPPPTVGRWGFVVVLFVRARTRARATIQYPSGYPIHHGSDQRV